MKVSCTYTTIITANIFFILFLVPVLFYIKRQKDTFHKKEIKMILVFFWILIIRLFTPFEYPVTYSVYITDLYAKACEILRDTKILNINIMIFFCVISFCGTMILSIIRISQYRRFLQLLSYGETIQHIPIQNMFGKTIEIPMKQIKFINEVFLVGLLKPMIIVPEILVGKEEYIIEHELEHFKNHDQWYKLLVDILCLVYWWNPLVYVLKRYIENILELRNDFSVTKNMTEKEKIEYADTIFLHMKEKNKMKLGLGLTKNLSKTRIYSLLIEKTKKTTKFYFVMIILILSSFFVVIEPRGVLNLNHGQFTLEEDNLYLIKEREGYSFYINDEYMGNIEEIPKELFELEILELREENR